MHHMPPSTCCRPKDHPFSCRRQAGAAGTLACLGSRGAAAAGSVLGGGTEQARARAARPNSFPSLSQCSCLYVPCAFVVVAATYVRCHIRTLQARGVFDPAQRQRLVDAAQLVPHGTTCYLHASPTWPTWPTCMPRRHACLADMADMLPACLADMADSEGRGLWAAHTSGELAWACMPSCAWAAVGRVHDAWAQRRLRHMPAGRALRVRAVAMCLAAGMHA